MNSHEIVFDHDGTLTDGAKEAQTYVEAFEDSLAKETRMGTNELHEQMEEAEGFIRAHPETEGWLVNGIIVAPATADHMVLATAAATRVLENLSATQKRTPKEIETLLRSVFEQAHKKTGTFYRPYAQEVVMDLHARGNFHIVTNSKTDTVRAKLHELLRGSPLNADVLDLVGDAKKWFPDDAYDGVAATVQLPGFPRPVFLRRPFYASVLKSFDNPVGVVVGDIYELDLALPEAFGIYTILATSDHSTLPWERAYYENHPNGKSASTLLEVREALENIPQ